MRKTNKAGRDLIESFEQDILFAYDDKVRPTRPFKKGDTLVGTLTIGKGHTGPDVLPGMVITQERSDTLFARDLDLCERAVRKFVKVPLTDNQFAALVSFAFNVGNVAFANSSLLAALNRGDYAAVPLQLARWNKTTIDGHKRVSQGLVRRRAAEAELWSRDLNPLGAAPPAELKERNLLMTKTGAGLATAGLGESLREMGEQIGSFAYYSEVIAAVATVLVVGGIIFAIYGRWHALKQERAA